MKLNHEFVLREVAGETLLVPVGKTTASLNGMLTLNEAGAFLWARLPEAADAEALALALTEEYEVDLPTARADVGEFLTRLRDLGILGEE